MLFRLSRTVNIMQVKQTLLPALIFICVCIWLCVQWRCSQSVSCMAGLPGLLLYGMPRRVSVEFLIHWFPITNEIMMDMGLPWRQKAQGEMPAAQRYELMNHWDQVDKFRNRWGSKSDNYFTWKIHCVQWNWKTVFIILIQSPYGNVTC